MGLSDSKFQARLAKLAFLSNDFAINLKWPLNASQQEPQKHNFKMIAKWHYKWY